MVLAVENNKPYLIIMFLCIAGVDFAGVSSDVAEVSFSPFPYTYTLLDDELNEPAEMFFLVLSARQGSSIAPGLGTATITILDNDGMYSIL